MSFIFFSQVLLERLCHVIVYLVSALFLINVHCECVKLNFDLLTGDTINVASRMESTGEGKRVFNKNRTQKKRKNNFHIIT